MHWSLHQDDICPCCNNDTTLHLESLCSKIITRNHDGYGTVDISQNVTTCIAGYRLLSVENIFHISGLEICCDSQEHWIPTLLSMGGINIQTTGTPDAGFLIDRLVYCEYYAFWTCAYSRMDFLHLRGSSSVICSVALPVVQIVTKYTMWLLINIK